jgi:SSS family solute:Na+ symporter
MADLPPLLGTLGLLAVVSAEISTADAILFMLATSLSQDLYRRFVRPEASEARVLQVARGAAILGGAAGVGLAILVPTVIGALSFFYTILSVSLFVPLVAGLYARRVGTPEAVAALAGGTLSLLAAQLAGPDTSVFGLPPAALGLLGSAAACQDRVGCARRS